jgi:phospholipid transport system substrate-binding protein
MLLALPLALLLAWPARAEPGPAAVVEALHVALLATMREGKALGFAGRFERLAPIVAETFDLEQMARLAAGPTWSKFSAQEQQEVAASFRRYSIANYAARFADFAGQRFELAGQREQEGLGTLVETRLQPGDGTPVTLTYLLRRRDGNWRAIDVYLAGTISELAVRRAEFAAVLARDGVGGLVKLLDQRSQEMAKRD